MSDTRKWTRQWVSDNGNWQVEKEGRKWYLYHRCGDDEWELWGHWERAWPYPGKDYVPFDTLGDAIAEAEAAEFKGVDDAL